MGASRSLEQIQLWMQTVVTDPGGVLNGASSPDAQAAAGTDRTRVEDLILPSRALSSVDRLAVYANAYYTRLLHCLQELFPALRFAVGEEVFDDFAFAYLQRYPSQSYTLGHLADRFAQFLDETRVEYFAAEASPPAGEGDDARADLPAWSDFIVELARLEYTIDDVFDGPGIENEPPTFAEQFAALDPAQAEQARFELACCVRLLAFEYPVSEYFTAFKRGATPELPERQATWLAVTRRDYVVRRYPLSSEQYALLTALQSGASLGDALAAALATGLEEDRLAAALKAWFAQWAHDRFFVHVGVPGSSV
ncbi:MAG: DNA-binding domain-containing protein [Pirellulales bacterium]|nr:DNA-binding domain-containing protein [Pirellulales bacterium]